MAALNKLVENEVDTDEKREMLASVGGLTLTMSKLAVRSDNATLGDDSGTL